MSGRLDVDAGRQILRRAKDLLQIEPNRLHFDAEEGEVDGKIMGFVECVNISSI